MTGATETYSLKVFKSHLELEFSAAAADASWADLESIGDHVKREIDERKSPVLVVDLTQLTYMGSSLVALLVRFWKEISHVNGSMVVAASNPVVRETLSLAGLDKIWKIFFTIEQACAYSGVTPSTKIGDRSTSRKRMLIGFVVVAVILIGISIVVINQR